MLLNLITFASVFQKKNAEGIRLSHQELFQTLEEHYEINLIFAEDLTAWPTQGLSLIFVATGGTEGMIVQKYAELPHPLILLTDGKANSLAATLELSNWVRNQGDSCKILHGNMDTIVSEIQAIQKKSLLQGTRIGVLGVPSDWLVASGVDYTAAQERWGVQYVDIPLSEVEENYERIGAGDAAAVAQEFSQKAFGCKEPDEQEILKASRLYMAIEQVVATHHLDALTLQCFSLIPTTCTTGCLALSLLTDEGIPAGCEGDEQSIFTLLLVKRLTGLDGFMANPARIDVGSREIILAHCTIGLKQTKNYIIRSHFESQSGVAIQGILPTGEVTICKVGGKNLDQFVAFNAQLLENQDDPNKCRTQVRIQLEKEEDARYFLTRNIGNHHIILRGHHAQEIASLFNK